MQAFFNDVEIGESIKSWWLHESIHVVKEDALKEMGEINQKLVTTPRIKNKNPVNKN